MNIRILCVTLLSATLMLTPVAVRSEMVNTTQLLSIEARQSQIQQVETYLARDDVREQMERMGVNPVEASDRVAALTDSQLQQLALNIDTMPAGSDALGILVTFLVIILLLEILGITNVSAKI